MDELTPNFTNSGEDISFLRILSRHVSTAILLKT
jgi:hypothetical protein